MSRAPVSLPQHTHQSPNRSITIVVRFPPGGGHDFTARTIAARLSARRHKNMPYHDDFTPATLTGVSPIALLTHLSTQFASLHALIKLA